MAAFPESFSREFGIELPGESQPFFHTQKDNLRVRIEKHSEFFSITLIFDNVVRKGRNLNGLFVADGADLVPAALLRNAPSPVLVATWVETIDDERELQPSDIATMFGHDNFAAARVGDEHGEGLSFQARQSSVYGRRVYPYSCPE